ncbi:MAG: S-layer homology domain-containing protein [Bacillota bacterium]
MKKIISIILIFSMCIIPVFAGYGYEPGITGDMTSTKNVYKYKEVVFLTGEPILLDGTVKVTESGDGGKTTLEYKLSNAAKQASLSRKIVYLNTKETSDADKQILHNSTLDPKFAETITIGSESFKLTEYLFSRSGITDDKPIIKYNVSNWNGRKVYQRGTSGEVVIDISTDQYGYNNYWSNTETAIVANTITYRYKENDSDTQYSEIVGTAEYAVSNSTTKYLQYVSNEPVDISFKGGYILKEAQDNIVMYLYDVPVMESWKPNGKRNKGRDSYRMTTVPTQTRLYAPSITDVSASYWAAEYVQSVASLDIITPEGGYFRPLSYISRAEFARAMVRAANIKEPAEKEYTMKFIDVEKNHPYYSYIRTAAYANIMGSKGNNRFSPDDYLTKVEALTIIVRAMGLENSADESSTSTPFDDDYLIPAWAKRCANVALRMGLVKADENNELDPNRLLTRAECSEMISNFIKYLQYDIKSEYREKIINYGR